MERQLTGDQPQETSCMKDDPLNGQLQDPWRQRSLMKTNKAAFSAPPRPEAVPAAKDFIPHRQEE
jgi:hypothetical protein